MRRLLDPPELNRILGIFRRTLAGSDVKFFTMAIVAVTINQVWSAREELMKIEDGKRRRLISMSDKMEGHSWTLKILLGWSLFPW